ncbi:hypothetical protein VNI00_004919 [Paramarasmius palmivorus]|uniref:FBD domain-containing protein n=1 Tax=Paramarasmius palmivorus TaxID=297713 RepID=A0AAW0B699_9AGAR
MIVPELRRCEELAFHGEWEELAQVAPIQRSFAFPHLRSLDSDTCLSALIDGIGLVPPTFLWFSRALKTAPKLAKVNIAGIVSLAVLPCYQLTTVCGSELEVAQVARILRSCPNLQNLEVVFLLAGPDPSPNVIVHSSLQELTIHIDADWLVEVVSPLARFSFPALQTFTLNMETSGLIFTDPTSAVITIIRCFSASLRKLMLVAGSLNMRRTFFTDILHVCPNLHRFAVEVDAVYSEDDSGSEYILHLIQSLTITDTSQAFLAPKLTELGVREYGSRMTADYATAFLNMVESRSAGIGVTRLTDAELKYTRREFAQPGLDYTDSCISDSSIVERVKLLSRKEIHCEIGAIRD